MKSNKFIKKINFKKEIILHLIQPRYFFLLGIILISFIGILSFSGLIANYSYNQAGIEIIYTNNSSEINSSELNLILMPTYNDPEIYQVIVFGDLLENRSEIKMYFPGIIYKLNYLNDSDLSKKNIVPWISAEIDLLYGKSRDTSEQTFIIEPFFTQSIVNIQSNEIENFKGVTFFWADGIQKLSFSKMGLSLHFQTSKLESQLQSVAKYKILIISPHDYEIVTSIPSPSGFKIIGGMGMLYQFDINAQNNDIYLIFENKNKAKAENYFLIIFSIIFGIGLTIIVEDVRDYIKNK